MKEIRNKVTQNDSLMAIDLSEFLPQMDWEGIDIANFLEQGFVLKEKNFRTQLENLDFSHYQNKTVYLYCSTEAIFPEWVYLLLTSKLFPHTNNIYIGDLESAQSSVLQKAIEKLDYKQFKNKKLILKGCGSTVVSVENMNTFFEKCLPFAQSIMFGEACGAVPIYKKSKI